MIIRKPLHNKQENQARNECYQRRFTMFQTDLILNAIEQFRLGQESAETRLIGQFILWSESDIEQAREIFTKYATIGDGKKD